MVHLVHKVCGEELEKLREGLHFLLLPELISHASEIEGNLVHVTENVARQI